MNTILTLFTLFAGLKWINDTRKSVEDCHDEHLRDEFEVTNICIYYGYKVRRTLMYGIFLLVMGTIAIWYTHDLSVAILFAGNTAIYTGLTCSILFRRMSFRIRRYRTRKSGLRTGYYN